MYSEYIYVLKAGPYYKIGRTNELTRRIGQLKIQLPFQTELYKVFNTEDSAKLEKHLHAVYSSLRVNGEWFALSSHEAILLKLLPSSINREDFHDFGDRWHAILDIASEAINEQLAERDLERAIKERVEDAKSEIPDSWGDLEFSDMLAFECPYPLEASGIEWLVADDTEEGHQ